jgi:6,7-dimethyl-8-ribityllumazine synthase
LSTRARKGFLAEMLALGYQESRPSTSSKSAARSRCPLHAKLLAKTGRYAGIVGLPRCVVDGGIYRHDFVAQSVVSGLMQVQLETEVPVFSVSLTPHHFHAGEEHQKFFFEHFVHKARKRPEHVWIHCRKSALSSAWIRSKSARCNLAAPLRPRSRAWFTYLSNTCTCCTPA